MPKILGDAGVTVFSCGTEANIDTTYVISRRLKKESACIDSFSSEHDSLDLPLSGTNLSSKFTSNTQGCSLSIIYNMAKITLS